jgi:hypothetical protein
MRSGLPKPIRVEGSTKDNRQKNGPTDKDTFYSWMMDDFVHLVVGVEHGCEFKPVNLCGLDHVVFVFEYVITNCKNTQQHKPYG